MLLLQKEDTQSSKDGTVLTHEELKIIVKDLRELGLSYDEIAKLVSEVTNEAKPLKPLWEKSNATEQKGSQLVKLGVALIAFPIPTVGIKKSLGAMLIAAGLLKERRKHIHIADVYSTFQEVNMELQKLQQKSA